MNSDVNNLDLAILQVKILNFVQVPFSYCHIMIITIFPN